MQAAQQNEKVGKKSSTNMVKSALEAVLMILTSFYMKWTFPENPVY